MNPFYDIALIYRYLTLPFMHTLNANTVHVGQWETSRSLQQHFIPPPRMTSSVVSSLLIGNLPPMLTCYWLVYCEASRQHFTIAAIRARQALFSNLAEAESSTHPPSEFLQINTPTRFTAFHMRVGI